MNTANPYRPVCPALLFAERVDVDVARKRIDIHNLMNGAVATAFPAPLSFWIHFSLTGGQGDYRMKLSLEHDQSGELLELWEGAASLRTPMVMHEQPVQVSVVVQALRRRRADRAAGVPEGCSGRTCSGIMGWRLGIPDTGCPCRD